MYRSKELRWFSRQETEHIAHWFLRHHLSFDTVESRSDQYLVDYSREDIAPKLREGNIEIKYRIHPPREYALSRTVNGYFEEWVKWSFQLDARHKLAREIISGQFYAQEWLEVQKERMGVKVIRQDGDLEIHSIEEFFRSGCQIEYTRIQVAAKTWYSFNLEWFGDEFTELDDTLLLDILGDSALHLQESMGYGKFLKQMR